MKFLPTCCVHAVYMLHTCCVPLPTCCVPLPTCCVPLPTNSYFLYTEELFFDQRVRYHCLCRVATWVPTWVPPTNTKFRPLLLPTQTGIPYTNTHKHRTSYSKSTLTFVSPAKRWKSIYAARQKPEFLRFFHNNNNYNNHYQFQTGFLRVC